MATMSMAFTVASILAKEYPKGLTRQELFEKANSHDPDRFGDCIGMLDFVLGIRDGMRQDYGLITCWIENDGKIFYDTSRRTYAPSFERFGFSERFNDWLKRNNLAHLILYEKRTPDNSEQCSLGFEWGEIPHPGHCNWDSENEGCHPESGCYLSLAKLQATSIAVEKRDYRFYRRKLDGD